MCAARQVQPEDPRAPRINHHASTGAGRHTVSRVIEPACIGSGQVPAAHAAFPPRRGACRCWVRLRSRSACGSANRRSAGRRPVSSSVTRSRCSLVACRSNRSHSRPSHNSASATPGSARRRSRAAGVGFLRALTFPLPVARHSRHGGRCSPAELHRLSSRSRAPAFGVSTQQGFPVPATGSAFDELPVFPQQAQPLQGVRLRGCGVFMGGKCRNCRKCRCRKRSRR
jgi:hypothetical protein